MAHLKKAVPGSPSWWEELRAPRRTRGRPPVPIDRIAAAGVELLDGAVEYSIRNVAAHLGSSTATLYRRLGGRSGLDALVVDAVIAEAVPQHPVELASQDWRQACFEDANSLFMTLSRHPRVVGLVSAQIPAGPQASLFKERFIGRLLAAHFSPAVAALTYTSVARITLGFGFQLAYEPMPFGADSPLPATALVEQQLGTSLQEEFQFGVQMMLDGVAGSL